MSALHGMLLLSAPELSDPNFTQTVILIVQHGDDGALGLVLNRPLVGDAIDESDPVFMTGGDDTTVVIMSPINRGGPCDGPLMVIHTDPDAAQTEVLPGVFFTADQHVVETLIGEETLHGVAQRRVFAGYAGWGPGQLEQELLGGAWIPIPGTASRVFDLTASLWSRLLREDLQHRCVRGLHPLATPVDPLNN